jgi:hypothetical protein
MKLALKFAKLRVEVELAETATTRMLTQALPFESTAQAPGTVCFWTEGDAIALPYGRTPISSDERPKLASRCNVLGKIVGEPRRLAAVKAGESVTVEKA